jgi:hypothetical protein
VNLDALRVHRELEYLRAVGRRYRKRRRGYKGHAREQAITRQRRVRERAAKLSEVRR